MKANFVFPIIYQILKYQESKTIIVKIITFFLTNLFYKTKAPISNRTHTMPRTNTIQNDRVKRKRETSPVTGYISLKSDNPMNVSKGIASDLR